MRRLWPLAVCGWVACTPSGAPRSDTQKQASTSASASSAAPAATGAFGKPLDPATPFVELATLRANPQAWDGKRVRTSGKVVAVCQSAGCWADLLPVEASAGPPVHIGMHGHAFLLPRNARERLADVEGTVEIRTLSPEQAAHFNSEGASLTAGAPLLAMDASGVVLR